MLFHLFINTLICCSRPTFYLLEIWMHSILTRPRLWNYTEYVTFIMLKNFPHDKSNTKKEEDPYPTHTYTLDMLFPLFCKYFDLLHLINYLSRTVFLSVWNMNKFYVRSTLTRSYLWDYIEYVGIVTLKISHMTKRTPKSKKTPTPTHTKESKTRT